MQKKTILFIADKPNWAYHFIIKTWAELLPEYQCFVAFAQDFQIRAKKFGTFEVLKNKIGNIFKNDEISFKISSDRNYSFPIYKNPPVYEVLTDKKVKIQHFDIMVEMAYYFQFLGHLPFTSEKKIVGIFTDGYPHEGPSFDYKNQRDYRSLSREDFYKSYLKHYDGIIVGCNNLKKAYEPFSDKVQFTYGIYRQEDFGKTKISHSEFTIGWTGNPNREMKGFKEIIIPAIEKVRKTGRNIRLKTKHSGEYEELFDFYSDVDLVVIASRADSGPSLFAEASLSNIPCISTPVGLPEMVIRHNENGIIINRDIDEMTNAIIELYDNREKLSLFSKRIKNDYLSILGNKTTIEHFKNLVNRI